MVSVENTHEPIIDKEVFYRVQEQIKIKTQTDKGKSRNADICRACPVCGLWLVYEVLQKIRQIRRLTVIILVVSTDNLAKGYCSMHYIAM